MKEKHIYKSSSFNFVPITKTPWGGSQISKLKKKYFSEEINNIPDFIGESLEVYVKSLLIKWIDAKEPLSVQVHPKNSHPALQIHECGKPEAWFVYSLHNPSPVHLGFKDGYSVEEIKASLQSEDPLKYVHSFLPEKHSYISIPTGCVHALGSGTFIAEPQCVIPQKEGKTWRLFDWNRLYNDKGQRDNSWGKPRQLHVKDAISAIDWTLPRGAKLEQHLVKKLKHTDRFEGDKTNPFCLQLFTKKGTFHYNPLVLQHFSLLTVFEGNVTISNEHEKMTFTGGESGYLPPSSTPYSIEINSQFDTDPCLLLFSLNERYLNNLHE